MNNWLEKIEYLQNKPDESRELKRGEVKSLIISAFSEKLSEFHFEIYKSGTYYFQRIRNYKNFPICEILHVSFSLKNKIFCCSISSCFNTKISNVYNSGKLNKHIDLIVIKKKSGIIPIEEAYYYHNGKIETTENIVAKITGDYEKYGLKFLNNRFEGLEQDALLNTGLDYILKLGIEKNELKKSLEEEINSVKFYSSIKNSIYQNLKHVLLSVSNRTREERKEISKLTFELLEFYCDR